MRDMECKAGVPYRQIGKISVSYTASGLWTGHLQSSSSLFGVIIKL